MPQDNLSRMIRLAEEFFDVRNDPAQLAVTHEVMDRLRRLHPRTLNEASDADGPFAWVLVIPTSRAAMEKFLSGGITERDLPEEARDGSPFEALYLCSALVLPEYRGKGLAKRLTLEAIASIRLDHPIRALYYWAFSGEGKELAETVAAECDLPLFKRED